MSTIELKAEDLYDKEKVDLETIVIEDVFKLLQCDDQGLTDEEAKRRYDIFGPNKLETEEQNAFLQVCPLSLCAAIVPDHYHSLRFSVPRLHVEPAFLGHGGCRSCRHCSFQR